MARPTVERTAPNNGRSRAPDPPASAEPSAPPPARPDPNVGPEARALITTIQTGRAAGPKVDQALQRLKAIEDRHAREARARTEEHTAASREWMTLKLAAHKAIGAEHELIRLAPPDLAETHAAAHEAEAMAYGALQRAKIDLEAAREQADRLAEPAAAAKKLKPQHRTKEHTGAIERHEAALARVGELTSAVKKAKQAHEKAEAARVEAAAAALRAASGGAITTPSPRERD